MAHSSLPLELIEHIIEDLAHIDLAHVQNCALTCRSFLPICRRHLFSKLLIRIAPVSCQPQSTENLVTLLRKSPEIADYARHIVFILRKNGMERLEMPMEFKMFSRLKSYELSCNVPFLNNAPLSYYYLDFNEIDTQLLKEVLLHPIPTLTTLKLMRVANFPFDELMLHCPDVCELVLTYIRTDERDDTSMPTRASLSPIKLQHFRAENGTSESVLGVQRILELRQSNGQPVLDISGLKHLDLSCYYDDPNSEGITVRTMLLQTNQLTTLILRSTDTDPVDLSGIGQPLLASRETLKEIYIYSNALEVFDVNPLHGLSKELDVFGRYPNVLETLSYELQILLGDDCSTWDEWVTFDRVIDTHEWPKLKRISFRIICNDFDGEYDSDDISLREDLKRRLEALPEEQLPRLHAKSRKDLDFRFKVDFVGT